MNYPFAIYIWGLGIAALVVVAFPFVVVLGLYAGILPGILLGLSPSLFVYSLLWWGLYALTTKFVTRAGYEPATDLERKILRRTVGALAILFLAVPAILIPRVLNIPIENVAAKLRAEDREASDPISLPPVTAIVWSDNYDRSKKKIYCDTLCQRLLFNSAVSRVIVADQIPPNATGAFWIERRDNCPDPAISRRTVRFATDFPIQRGKTPEDRVRARIAAGECLLEGSGSLDEASATISFGQIKRADSVFSHPWALQLDTVAADRLEILEAGGRVLFRRTEVTSKPLIVPLSIGMAAGLLTSVTYVGWSRSNITAASTEPSGRNILPSLLGAAIRPPDLPEQ